MGATKDWSERNWSWWRPGKTVQYIHIHDDADAISLQIAGGRRFDAYDAYCVTPGCKCSLMSLGFYTVAPAEEELIGIAWIDHDVWELHEADPEPGWEAATADLAAAFLEDRNTLAPLVAVRQKELRKLGPEIARRAAPATPHQAQRGGAKVKANEPCPCGSGKKYKACCMP